MTDAQPMSVTRRKRLRFLLLGILVLGIGFGAVSFSVHEARGIVADVTVAGVTRKSEPDRLWVDLKIRMRGITTCSWVRNEDGAITVTPAMKRVVDDVSIVDWYLRPSIPRGGLGTAFEFKAGEDVEVHVSPPESKWLRDGEELVIVSSSRGGTQVRSLALRFEATSR